MIDISIPVFSLMLGAAVLGFLIAWVLLKNKMEDLQKEFITHQNNFLKTQGNYNDLLEHTNSQSGEKEKLIQKIDDQQLELAALKLQNKQLVEDKNFLLNEIENLKRKKDKMLSLPQQLSGEFASMKSQIDELAQEKENWREKYMIIRDANDEHLAQLSAMESSESEAVREETVSSEKIDWKEEFQQMQLELNQKLKTYQDSNKQLRSEYKEMKDHYLDELENLIKNNESLIKELKELKSKSDPSE